MPMKKKLLRAYHRLTDIFQLFPVRFLRLLRHLLFLPQPVCLQTISKSPFIRAGFWLLDTIMYTLEIFGLNELAETAMDFLKPKTRVLNEKEMAVLRDIFGDNIRASRIVIDTSSRMAKSKKVAFVSFNTIHHWGEMKPNLMAHELTHVWQYQKFGGVYLFKALQAQHSQEGYNYGGEEGLTEKASFLHFNMEQQGDIVEDYYRLKTGIKAQWLKQPNDITLKKLDKMKDDLTV